MQTSRLSALVDPSSVFATRSPSSTGSYVDSVEAARHYEPSTLAAAQWLLYAGEALHELCAKRAIADVGSPRWTPQRWDSWKVKFETVAADDRFGIQARDFAARAASRMAQIKENGFESAESIVQRFDLIIPEEDESEGGDIA